jgi:tetratricopeptide (TPR) repeat protein
MSLGALRDKSAIDPLCARVSDPDASVSKAAIEALFTIAGDDCEKLMQVGQVLIAKPDYASAVRFLEKLLDKYGNSRDRAEDVWRAKDALAQCYAKAGEWKKARPLYEDLMKRYPERADIRQGLVRAMVQNKEFKRAADLYLDCLKEEAEQPQAWWAELYKLLNENLGEMSGPDVVGVIQEAEALDPKLGGDALHDQFIRLKKKAEQMMK